MNTLSPEAREYLRKMLLAKVNEQVTAGYGEEPMPDYWTELHQLSLEG